MPDLHTEINPEVREINSWLFFHLFQAANTLHTKGSQAVENFGMTTQLWSILGALSRPQVSEGMSIGDLSRYLLVTRQNLAGLLSRLERDGLIERVTIEDDRRSRKVKLSKQGNALWRKLQEPIHSFYDQALKGLSFGDRLEFIHYFTKLQANISKL